MTTEAIERVFLADESATAHLGARLAATLHAGDVVLLEGGLGAGKTALARALIRAYMDDTLLEVPSPSFSLVQSYQGAKGSIIHADLYRLGQSGEIDELGLFDRADAIVLIEWPERAPAVGRNATLRITLDIPADHRGRIAEITR